MFVEELVILSSCTSFVSQESLLDSLPLDNVVLLLLELVDLLLILSDGLSCERF